MTLGKNQHKWSLVLLLLIAACGCRDSKPTEIPAVGSTMSAEELEALRKAPLRLLFVGSPALAEELKIQFEGRGGVALETTVIDEAQWATTKNETLDLHDVLLVPPDRLAPLVAEGKLLQFPTQFLDKWAHSHWASIDRRIGRVQSNTFGISWGTPLSAVLANPSFTDGTGSKVQVPNTWSEWQDAAEQDRQAGRPLRWVESLVGNHAAEALLLRAASLAKSQSQSDVFYARGEGIPRLNSPPFIQAMNDMKATYGPSVAELKTVTHQELIKKLQAGEIAGALMPVPRLDDVAQGVSSLVLTPPPGSTRFYDFFDQTWSDRSTGPFRTQISGLSGRVICVMRRTRKSEAAFRLTELLISSPTAETLAPLQEKILIARPDQWNNVSQWAGRQYSVEATDKIREIWNLANDDVQGGCEFFPALPGNQERLRELTEAVWHVLENRKDPAAALEDCQQAWIEIGKKNGPPDPLTLLQND
ncbi:MAG: hypothetical protein JNL67_12570 [Planctomycetaceae bacterium]|nr:hypothetical protein [Planctomycetaceae bacterium]